MPDKKHIKLDLIWSLHRPDMVKVFYNSEHTYNVPLGKDSEVNFEINFPNNTKATVTIKTGEGPGLIVLPRMEIN